ncbi:MAG: hypothetical protein IKD04_03875 [Clostridia bacterium]|nr:hypothetical protein [Clostridia bacterium]
MDFKNVPKKYRPIPFWSWNEKLQVEETKLQISQMNEVGFGGYFMHARGGLETEYIGEEWFDNISAGVEMGKKLGMKPWAYDENGWPSGFGNGIVNGKGIKFQQKHLCYEKGEKQTKSTIANIDGYHYYYEVNPFYVDLLDSEVTKTFLEEIYAPYYEKYGNDIEGFFTDEPQLSRNYIPWSFVLEPEFKREYGEDLISVLPQLFFSTGDYMKTRIKFWRLVTKLFSNSFIKQIYDWCDERGLKFTGHMVNEDDMWGQLPTNGTVMPNYRFFHIPGMDCLGRQKISKTTIYQLTSVAEQFGKEQVLSETFALTGWNVDFEELKAMYEWQMVRGVNLLCTHLSAYSIRGIRKRDFPAFFSYQEPWWDKLNVFIDSMSRIGMLLAKGKCTCDTLLIHPQTTAWAYFNFGHYEIIREYNNKFNSVINELENKHIRFHLGDELIIEENARVEGNKFIIGNQAYSTIVLPPHLVLFDSTKSLLEEFKNNGGLVIEDVNEIENDKSIVDDERIVYTKRSFDDFDVYYFVNTKNEKVHANVLKGTHTLNIITGEKEPFGQENVFEPSGSLVVLDYRCEFPSVAEEKAEYKKIDLSGQWDITEYEYNAITLDKCDYSFDSEVIEKNGPVISIQDKACALGRKVRIDMKYTVKAEYVPNEAFLVCETPEIFEISVNGKMLQKKECGYYRDRAFKKLNLSGYLKEGNNEILVSCNFEQSEKTYKNLEKAREFESEKNKLTYDMEIESIYIIGDFSVKTDGEFTVIPKNAVRYKGDFVIAEPKRSIKLQNIEQQGFSFFNGKMVLSKNFDLKNDNYKIEFNTKLATVVSVKVNGKQAGDLLWKPYSLDITPYIKEGDNNIEITLVSSLRNLLGPHHIEEGESYDVTPASFFKEDTIWGTWFKKPWNDDYCFVNIGLIE